jgi:hypothetical protein
MSFNNRTNKRMIEFNKLLAQYERDVESLYQAVYRARSTNDELDKIDERIARAATIDSRQELRTFVNLI